MLKREIYQFLCLEELFLEVLAERCDLCRLAERFGFLLKLSVLQEGKEIYGPISLGELEYNNRIK